MGLPSSHLTFLVRHVQQPVLDRGGSLARGVTLGAVLGCPLRLELAEEEWSSFGAMTGRRRGVFLEASPRLSSCITRVPVVELFRICIDTHGEGRVTRTWGPRLTLVDLDC